MPKKFFLAFLIFSLLNCKIPDSYYSPSFYENVYPLRNLKVCVFIDSVDSPPKTLIKKIIENVSKEYSANVGISFKPVGYRFYNDSINWESFDRKIYASEDECVKGSDWRFLFTRRPSGITKTYFNEISYTIGHANEKTGNIAIYEFDDLFLKRDAKGHIEIYSVLKHEIGHLFGLGHSKDPNSFMYSTLSGSKGEWTKDISYKILSNKYRRWNRFYFETFYL